jgi:hypothetical protein
LKVRYIRVTICDRFMTPKTAYESVLKPVYRA